jgi:hypothetical protein
LTEADPNSELGKSYRVLQSLAPVILQHEGKGEMAGFLLDQDHPQTIVELNGYRLDVRLDDVFGSKAKSGFGLIIALGPNEFLGAGSGFMVAFSRKEPGHAKIGIGAIDQGTFSEGGWVPGRRLNGDENNQGGNWRFSPVRVSIERVVLYQYE